LIAAGAGVVIGGAGATVLGSVAGVAIIGSLFGVAGAGLTGRCYCSDLTEHFVVIKVIVSAGEICSC